ncbi:hypothetical protein [Aureimonas jatrophae]|uniref:Uncharacterized protein n=1 Tax=Aureimonas jatrophae TaxID=1166073 RepID=A0A1H0LIV2_9HYPH|nr:hypothetical protein [Aureimonas jatrophae]MBB3952539.1 hypothetical protein [Aureimonas jatrophae]SDO68119.1 hypothetical protein SAMN05192530_11056 [Aureimonas jatrophae]
MITLALVSEGHTDQVVLEKIVELVCSKNNKDVDVNYLQPIRDETDRNKAVFGGFELVFEYCRFGIKSALEANDFIIVQIDTDMGEHVNFGVPLTVYGQDRPDVEIISDTINKVKKEIGTEILSAYGERIIYAVSVHSTESWLIAILKGTNETKNSFERLNRYLHRSNFGAIDKSIKDYRRLSRSIKYNALSGGALISEGLALFITQLEGACRNN